MSMPAPILTRSHNSTFGDADVSRALRKPALGAGSGRPKSLMGDQILVPCMHRRSRMKISFACCDELVIVLNRVSRLVVASLAHDLASIMHL